MVKFEEPKVEFIKISTNQVVYASPTGAGSVLSCDGDESPRYCGEQMASLANK